MPSDPTHEVLAERASSRWLEAALVGGGLLLVLLYAILRRDLMNPDGVAYLDLSDHYLRGEWGAAVNLYWSPLLPWLLSVARRIAGTDPRAEFALAHGVLFATFLASLGGFVYFVRAVGRGPVLLLLGYSLFIWSSVRLILPSTIAPDYLVAAAAYVAAGLLARMREKATVARDVGLGAVLGAGYLAKAAMLPIGVLYAAAAALAAPDWRRGVRSALTALGVMLLLSAPQIAALSARKGSPTFGENSRYVYARFVNRVDVRQFMLGRTPEFGLPRHGPRVLSVDAAALAWERRTPGTQPYWYAPSVWTEGLTPRVEPRQQLRTVASNAAQLADIVLPVWPGAVTLLLLALGDRSRAWRSLRPHAPALIASAGACAMYTLVLVDPRYFAPFVVIGALGVWAALGGETRGVGRAIALVMAISAFFQSVRNRSAASDPSMQSTDPIRARWNAPPAVAQRIDAAPPGSSASWAAAAAIQRLGAHDGDGVAVIGAPMNAYWARLGRLRIVADLDNDGAERFWADAAVRDTLMRRFGGSGAAFVAAYAPPLGAELAGWRQLGNTPWYAAPLTPEGGRP